MKVLRWLMPLCLILIALPVQAQVYGVGQTLGVPAVNPADLTLDGVANEAAWENAKMVDLVVKKNWWNGAYPQDITEAYAKLLYANDSLYVYVFINDDVLYHQDGAPWDSDHIMVGLDPVHEAGVTDQYVDEENYAGWPENAPDKGPHAYFITHGNGGNIGLQWGDFETDPVAEGWVRGTVWTDEANADWGIEAVFYVPGAQDGAEIGFNIGGGTAKEEACNEWGCAYGLFSRWATKYGGSDIISLSNSYGTLALGGEDSGGEGDGQYGVGETVVVPQVDPEVMVLNGLMDETIWDSATTLDLLTNANWYREDLPQDIEEAFARTLYANDTLYVYVFINDDELHTVEGDAWSGDQIIIGIDPIHIDGVTDNLVDQSNWAGWPENAPGAGPYALTAYPNADGTGGTVNFWWGYSGIDPVAEGWVRGGVWTDPENADWGVELAIYVPGLEPGSEIGFNVGGGTAKESACLEDEGCAYGFFSRWSTENPGSDVMSRTDSYATLQMRRRVSGDGYGTGIVVDVTAVDPSEIVLDGQADEAAWANARTLVLGDDYHNWSGGWNDGYGPEIDIYHEARILFAPDTVYVFMLFEDYQELYWGGEGAPYGGEQMFFAVDATFAGDDQVNSDWAGWPDNAPGNGPTVYKIWRDGITSNWGYNDVFPVDEGWVRGNVVVNEENFSWQVEMAIYVPGVMEGGRIGFNLGGATAHPSEDYIYSEDGEATYAYFAFHPQEDVEGGYVDPGDISRDAGTFSILQLGESTPIEDDLVNGQVPSEFSLSSNYPNPFSTVTNFEIQVSKAAHVSLQVFDLMGRHVTTLADGQRGAGTYRVRWETSDLPAGQYVYQLRVDGEVKASRIMTLLK